MRNTGWKIHLTLFQAIIRKNILEYRRYPMEIAFTFLMPIVWFLPTYFLIISFAPQGTSNGLASWIGHATEGIGGWPFGLLVAVVTAIIVLLTELTSNTATAAAFLPVVASVAVGIGRDPLLLVVPAALAASCAFMLPVATPPNAIVYGSGRVTIPQMVRAGFLLNLLFVLLITGLVMLLVPMVFGG